MVGDAGDAPATKSQQRNHNDINYASMCEHHPSSNNCAQNGH